MSRFSPELKELRNECHALIKVADGLIDVIRKDENVCNLSTMARLATEARAMVAKLMSSIERMLMPEPVQEPKKESFFGKIKKIVVDVAVAIFCY